MKRDKSLDIAKGIAIILMMYGHLRYTMQNMDAVYCWIYSFHMPFFIYITGFLTKIKTDDKWSQIKNKVKKIILPYIIWNVVGLLINAIFQLENQTISRFVHGLIFGDNLRSNLPTWYLLSFFWISLFAITVLPFLNTTKRLFAADVIAIFLVFMVAYFPQMQDYFRWKGAIVLLPFFITGYLLKKLDFRLPWWMVLPLLVVGYKLGRVNAIQTWGYVTVGNGTVGVPYLYLFSAICTILAMVELCRWLTKIPSMGIIGVFGRHTLIILCTHWVLGNVIEIYVEHGTSLFIYVFIIECVIISCLELLKKEVKGKRMKLEKMKKILINYILTCILGIFVFLLLYGVTPLDVTNDAWIMAGYDESDLIQHYAGWVMFRSSDWSFPLGMIKNMADGTGTMLTFTDSIPIVAIFFKAIDFLLPETFQYFGWYTLVCFILQAVAGYQLILRKSEKTAFCYMGELLFLLSPILLERAFRHTALGSQWFVLFALLIYLKSRDARKEGRELFSVGYLILNILTVLIHPYFLPMVMIFTVLTAWENVLQFHNWLKNGLYLIANIVLAYAAGWMVGALGWGVESARFGYGHFSMNLNALINPYSLGEYEWSKFFPTLPQIHGNYDGFNYLGAGVLALFILTAILGLKKWKECKNKKQWLKKNIYLILALLFLTIFAITNVVTWNDKELLNISIPDWLYWKAGIFRASGRMFYPVYYVIFTYAIYQLAEIKQYRIGLGILIVGVILQFADLRSVFVEKYEMMKENSTYVSILDDEVLTEAAKGRTKVVLSGVWDIVEMRRISVWAGKNGMKTSYTVANSGVYPEADALAEKETCALESSEYDRTLIYATQDIEVYKKWLSNLEENEITKYYYNDFYYLIPNLE